ncbi:hypothetical protein JCM8547_007925 [Rhodosporidiobolus lusitaniae]
MYVNVNGKVVPRRRHERVNGHNLLVVNLTRCNSDVKLTFLAPAMLLSFIFYATKYMTKSDVSVKRMLVIMEMATETALHQLETGLPAPAVAYYILYGKDHFASDQDSSTILEYNQVEDYVHRSAELEDVLFYLFALRFNVKLTKKVKECQSALWQHLFKAGHPRHCTHAAHEREVPAVPVLQSRLIPRRDHPSSTVRERYACSILALFQPWRDLDDLIAAGETWEAALARFDPDVGVTCYIDNLQLLHSIKDEGDKRQAAHEALGDCTSLERDGCNDQGSIKPEPGTPDKVNIEAVARVRMAETVNSKAWLVVVLEIISNGRKAINSITVEHPPHLKQDSSAGLTAPALACDVNHATNPVALAAVQGLNKKQTEVLCLIALAQFAVEEGDKTPRHIFIAGLAGSGKSVALDAVAAWMDLRGCAGQLQPAASTRTAAAKVKGMTLHSLLGYKRGKNAGADGEADTLTSKKDDFIVTDKVRAELGEVTMLCVDEVGMVGHCLMSAANSLLQQVKTLTAAFGGLITVWFGDFFQFAPYEDALLITPRHTLRRKVNKRRVLATALERGQVDLASIAQYLTSKRKAKTVDLQESASATPRKHGDCDAVVYLTVGMPVVLGTNKHTGQGVTTGAYGTATRISVAPEDEARVARASIGEIVQLRRPPPLVIVKMRDVHDDLVQLDGLEKGEVLITPVQGKTELSKDSGNYKFEQLPLSPAYTITDYCAQGATEKAVVIDLVPPGNRSRAESDPAIWVLLEAFQPCGIEVNFVEFDVDYGAMVIPRGFLEYANGSQGEH